MEDEMEIIFSSFLFTFLAIKALRPIADKVGLLDMPNYRKHHQGAVPLIGGVAIFIGVAITSLIFMTLSYQQKILLGSSLIIVLLGVFDDLRDISVRFRLFVQASCTIFMCLSLNVTLSYLGNMFGFSELNIGIIGYLVAVMAVIGGINAYNMMDGIDGLAGSMALISLIALIILFASKGAIEYIHWAMVFAVAIIPYLFANLRLGWFKQKIFMGDAGSMLLGFVIVWLLILGTQQETKYFRTVTALWIISVPLMDMAAIMIRRVRKGNSPFKPDRKHLHHIFLRAGLNSRQALAVIVVAAVLLTSIGIAGELWQVPEWIMLVGFLCLFAGYYYSLHQIWKIVRWMRAVKNDKY